MTTPFWASDPSVLLNKDDIFQLWPTAAMTSTEKLNAITRLVILLSVFGFVFSSSVRYLLIGAFTLLVIYALSLSKTPSVPEAFNNNDLDIKKGGEKLINPDTLQAFLKSEFNAGDKKNPMGNMLLTEIADKPDRKSAPPSFNPQVYEDINTSTKRMIQNLNPGIKNTNKQQFGDLGEEFDFDKSMLAFHSMPNTKVGNDQGAFANFLYGDMPSCRDGSDFACVQDNARYLLI